MSDPELALALVAYSRARPFLAVRRGSRLVDIAPLNAVSERADRAAILWHLNQWAERHPNVQVEIAEA